MVAVLVLAVAGEKKAPGGRGFFFGNAGTSGTATDGNAAAPPIRVPAMPLRCRSICFITAVPNKTAGIYPDIPLVDKMAGPWFRPAAHWPNVRSACDRSLQIAARRMMLVEKGLPIHPQLSPKHRP
ncbi:hypothetical protein CXB49_21585 [Chromobacterium sp. ATCC 53434]|nr:hypothetical protein CXB49_21585 [Chromobacterium sp. ATCC 53434]